MYTYDFRLPIYQDDKHPVVRDICAKKFPVHPTLSPGMVMMNCQHQICYGFTILRAKESTVGILQLLLTHFRKLPRIIIYDNACNLHRTCMIR